MSASAQKSETKTFRQWLGVRTCSKEATYLKDKLQRQTGQQKNSAKLLPPSDCLEHLENRLSGSRKGEHCHESCAGKKEKHPETYRVRGRSSSKEVGSLTILPKITGMNKEWYQKFLQEQLLPTVRAQFGSNLFHFQHDEAKYQKAKSNKVARGSSKSWIAGGKKIPQILNSLRTLWPEWITVSKDLSHEL